LLSIVAQVLLVDLLCTCNPSISSSDADDGY
jgi:hypothetical protein